MIAIESEPFPRTPFKLQLVNVALTVSPAVGVTLLIALVTALTVPPPEQLTVFDVTAPTIVGLSNIAQLSRRIVAVDKAIFFKAIDSDCEICTPTKLVPWDDALDAPFARATEFVATST